MTVPPNNSLLPQQFFWDNSAPSGKIWAGVPTSVASSGYQLVLDISTATGGGAGFLPLTGGTVTGTLAIDTAPVMSAGSSITPAAFFNNLNVSGTAPAGMYPYNKIGISDTVDSNTNNPGSAPIGLYVIHGVSGAATGGRCSLMTQIAINSALSPGSANPWFTSFQADCWTSYNVGGTAVQTNGAAVAYSFQTTLNSGATYYTMAEGFEGGVWLKPGSSASYVAGGKIVVVGQGLLATDILALDGGDGTAGSQAKFGITFQSLASPHWPIDPTGTIIGTQTHGADPPTARYGVDFSAVTFSLAAFKSNGFVVSPSGDVGANGATFASTLTANGSATFNAGFTLGAGVGGPNLHFNGGSSGTGAGPHMDFEFGGVARGGVGAYSGITGSAYDSRIMLSGFDGLVLRAANTDRMFVTGTGMGFNGTAAVAKPTVTGSKGANAALASLLTALASYGLVLDSST
jgi:hypothetical protein